MSFIAGWYLKASNPTPRYERQAVLPADESCKGGNDGVRVFYKVRMRLDGGQGLSMASFSVC